MMVLFPSLERGYSRYLCGGLYGAQMRLALSNRTKLLPSTLTMFCGAYYPLSSTPQAWSRQLPLATRQPVPAHLSEPKCRGGSAARPLPEPPLLPAAEPRAAHVAPDRWASDMPKLACIGNSREFDTPSPRLPGAHVRSAFPPYLSPHRRRDPGRAKLLDPGKRRHDGRGDAAGSPGLPPRGREMSVWMERVAPPRWAVGLHGWKAPTNKKAHT
jgi:hypothetical protein